MKKIAAALLLRDDKLFIAQRPEGKTLAHFWEFPGGKQEIGESLQQTLYRELQEELDIETIVGDFFMSSVYEYDFGSVEINCFWTRLKDESATVASNEHENTAWVSLQELSAYTMAPADIPIVDALQKLGSF